MTFPRDVSPLSAIDIGVCLEPPQAELSSVVTTYDGARTAHVYTPEDPSGAVWLVLPGLGGHATDDHIAATARALAYRGAIVVIAEMPQGPGDYLNAPAAIAAAVAFASALPGVDIARRIVLAFSMGGLCGFSSATAGFRFRVGWSALLGLDAGRFDSTYEDSFFDYLDVTGADDPNYASRSAATVYTPQLGDPPAMFFGGDTDAVVGFAANGKAAVSQLQALGIDARWLEWDGGHGVTLTLPPPLTWDTSAHVPRVVCRAAIFGQKATSDKLGDLASRG